MRAADVRDWLALRRHLSEPWRLIRFRKRGLRAPHVDVPFRGGFSVRIRDVPMDRHILHRIFARDEYRLDGVEPGSWDTVVDVGAHVGLFAVRVAPLARRVLCFEPAAENLEVLRRNLADARFAHVEVFPVALADRRGTLALYPSENPSAHSMYPPEPRGEAVRVEARALADVFSEQRVERCDLLKLDCEGAEYAILGSVPDALWPRIRRIRMEYHPVAGGAGWSGERLESFLRERGYACERLPARKQADKGHLFAERPG